MRIREEYRETTVIQKSRFIACLKSVRTEEEARAYIAEIGKEFSDATHVCTAFSLKDGTRRSSDNGEPSGTAGIPMLEAIIHSEVDDLCACVVRYFGGIKLGTGGLVRAYSGAVSSAITNAPKVIDVEMKRYRITYPYDMSGTLEGWLRKYTEIEDLIYSEEVTAMVLTDRDDIPETVKNLSRGSVEAVYIDTVLKEQSVEQ